MSIESFLQSTGRAREAFEFKPNGKIEEILGSWVGDRIEEAKQKLRKATSPTSQTLESSIQPIPKKEDNSYIVEVMAEDYYDYINKGVNGVSRQFGSPYAFKSLGVGSKMVNSFQDFIRAKNIKDLTWTNKQGETITKVLSTVADFKSAAYVLARATKKRGIKPNYFMDETFTQESIDELSEKLGLAVKQLFK